mmetsp:Transcript_242/g.248  ORF Transcript_242/g.248 Transcript_242/m.248 type:complete len:112 (+) Transcript_242:877-1212(+)
MNTHTLQYYGKEVITFKKEENEQNHGFVFIKCKDTTIIIEGKVKTVMLEGCQNIKLVVDDVVAGVEVLNSKKVGVTVKEMLKQFMIERSEGVQLYLPQGAKNQCKVNSTCS